MSAPNQKNGMNMGIVYRSKGISTKTLTKNLVIIVLCFAIAIALLAIGYSTEAGPSSRVTLPGSGTQTIRFSQDRFSEEEQVLFGIMAFIFVLLGSAQIGLLIASYNSWVDLRWDCLYAKSIGQSFSYRITDIVEITEVMGMLKISGSAGKVTLITDDPQKVHALLDELIRQHRR